MEPKLIKVAVPHEAVATYVLDPESNNGSYDSAGGLEKKQTQTLSAASHIQVVSHVFCVEC